MRISEYEGGLTIRHNIEQPTQNKEDNTANQCKLWDLSIRLMNWRNIALISDHLKDVLT